MWSKATLGLSSLLDMEGTIPSELLSLSNLRLLDLSYSEFSGTIVADFTKLPFLECIDLSNADISATLSSESCNMTLDALSAVQCYGMNLKDCSCTNGDMPNGDEMVFFSSCLRLLWTASNDHITSNDELSNEHLELF